MNPSGAIGGLWIKRSLEFQHDFYNGILQLESGKELEKSTTLDVAYDAYHKQLYPYHGSLLRNLYKLSLRAITPNTKEEILQRISGGQTLDVVEQDLKHLLHVYKPLLQEWNQIYNDLGLNDQSQV